MMILNDEKLNLMIGNEAEIVTHFFYSTLYWRVLISIVKKKHIIKRIQIGKKEIKLSSLADNVSMYKDNPKNLQKAY